MNAPEQQAALDPIAALAGWIGLAVEIVGGIGLGWLFAFVWLHM